MLGERLPIASNFSRVCRGVNDAQGENIRLALGNSVVEGAR